MKQLGLCQKIKYVTAYEQLKRFFLSSSRVIYKTVSIILLLDRNAFSQLQKENRFSTEAS